jgi:hypothetical protein
MWSHPSSNKVGGGLEYDLENSMFTTVEASFSYKKTFKMLLSFDYDENIVGKIGNFLGQIGYKNFSFRGSFGEIAGTANWKGMPVPLQPESAVVKTTYRELDLLYYRESGYYFGISYFNYTMPAEIGGAIASYDDSVEFSNYGFIMGKADMFDKMLEGDKLFGFFFDYCTGVYYTRASISDEGLRRQLFAGVTFRDVISTDVRSSVDSEKKANGLGISWEFTPGLYLRGEKALWGRPAIFGAGTGYNFYVTGYISLSAPIGAWLIRHGFVLKAFFSY